METYFMTLCKKPRINGSCHVMSPTPQPYTGMKITTQLIYMTNSSFFLKKKLILYNNSSIFFLKNDTI